MLDINYIELFILNTVTYFDLFDYPLTLSEIHHFLFTGGMKGGNFSLLEIEECLKTSENLQKFMTAQGGFYFLKNLKHNLNPFYLFLFLWLAVVFLIFQPAHSKLVSYILPLFPVLAMICGDYLCNAALSEFRNKQLFIANIVTLFVILYGIGHLKIDLSFEFGHLSL